MVSPRVSGIQNPPQRGDLRSQSDEAIEEELAKEHRYAKAAGDLLTLLLLDGGFIFKQLGASYMVWDIGPARTNHSGIM